MIERPSIRLAPLVVASFLILNAAQSGDGATPSNQSHTNQIEQTASGQHASAKPATMPRYQRSALPASDQSATNTYNYYYPAPESRLAFFGQIAGIVSAILLTAFTGGLWVTSILQWRALHAALCINRPIVLFAEIGLDNFAPMSTERPLPPVQGTFVLKNFGQGVARIREIIGGIVLVD